MYGFTRDRVGRALGGGLDHRIPRGDRTSTATCALLCKTRRLVETPGRDAWPKSLRSANTTEPRRVSQTLSVLGLAAVSVRGVLP